MCCKESDISFLVREFPACIKCVNIAQEPDVPEFSPVGLPSDGLQRCLDVRVAEHHLRAVHPRVKVAYGNMFPRLALTGQLGLDIDVLSNILESPYSLQNGAVLASLFGWGKSHARIECTEGFFRGRSA